MEFGCTQCGLCCKNLGRAFEQREAYPEWMQKELDAFPHSTRPDGSCEKLVGNLCSVYEHRPLMCDLNRAADELDIGMSKAEWFELNRDGCKQLQMEII